MEELCQAIRNELGTEVEAGRLGLYLQAWTDVENFVLSAARQRQDRVFSLSEALSVLRRSEALPQRLLVTLERSRKFRNAVVHQPKRVTPEDLAKAMDELSELLKELTARPM
jgi:uncharacterized protein YutE (UPF0331/DUF86 family)